MATSEFKKLAPEKIETEAAAQVAKEEKFIIDFVKDSYNLYLGDARLNPARNLEITKNQDKTIALFEEYEFEEKAKESERKTDQLNEIFDLESEIEKMLSPVISSEIKMPEKEESKLVPRTSGKILDVRYKVPVVKGTVLEVKLIDKKETIIAEPEEKVEVIEETEDVDDDYLDEFLNEIKRTIEIKETEEGLEKQSEAEKLLSLLKKPEPFFSLQSIKDIYDYFEIDDRILELLKKVEENIPASEVEENSTEELSKAISSINKLLYSFYESAEWAAGELNKEIKIQQAEYFKNLFKKGSLLFLNVDGILKRFIISTKKLYLNIKKEIDLAAKIQATIDVFNEFGEEVEITIDLFLKENLDFDSSTIKEIFISEKRQVEEKTAVDLLFEEAIKEADILAKKNIATTLFYLKNEKKYENYISRYISVKKDEFGFYYHLTKKLYWDGFGNKFGEGETQKIIGSKNYLFFGSSQESYNKIMESKEILENIIRENSSLKNYSNNIKIFESEESGVGVIVLEPFLWCGVAVAETFKNILKENIRKKYFSSIIKFVNHFKNTKRDLKFNSININNSFFENYKKEYKKINSFKEEEKERKYSELKETTKNILQKYIKKGNILLVNISRRKIGGHMMLAESNEIFFYPENYVNEDSFDFLIEEDLKISIKAYEGDTVDYKSSYSPSEPFDGDIEWSTTFKLEEYDILKNGLYNTYRFIEEDFIDSKIIEKKAEKILNPEIRYIPKG